jgi:hypothetical protein
MVFSCFGRICKLDIYKRGDPDDGIGWIVHYEDTQAAALAFRAFQDQHFSAAAHKVQTAMLHFYRSLAL